MRYLLSIRMKIKILERINSITVRVRPKLRLSFNNKQGLRCQFYLRLELYDCFIV